MMNKKFSGSKQLKEEKDNQITIAKHKGSNMELVLEDIGFLIRYSGLCFSLAGHAILGRVIFPKPQLSYLQKWDSAM